LARSHAILEEGAASGEPETKSEGMFFMRKTASALVVAALMTSAAWAGSMGNGHPRAGAAYLYCYGGVGKTEYFSQVFAVVPGVTGSGIQFGEYLTQQGYRNTGGMCRGAQTEASAAADKRTSEETFRGPEYHREVVETEWAGK
jgi:hypothetical protein